MMLPLLMQALSIGTAPFWTVVPARPTAPNAGYATLPSTTYHEVYHAAPGRAYNLASMLGFDGGGTLTVAWKQGVESEYKRGQHIACVQSTDGGVTFARAL